MQCRRSLSDPLVTALASIGLIYLLVNGRLQEQTAVVSRAAKTQSGFRERGKGVKRGLERAGVAERA